MPVARRKVLTLEEVVATYHEDCQVQGLKPSTIQGYQRSLRCFLRWCDQNQISMVPHFTPDAVKKYIIFLQGKLRWQDHDHLPTQEDTLSATTVRNYIRDLKAFASWLEREGYTTDNVLLKLRKPKADDIPVEPFSKDEIDTLFHALDLTDTFEFRDFVVMHTLWDTGMRVGELASLTLTDVNLKQCEIRIDHAKWGKWRDIGFGKQTQKYLSRYLAMCRPEPVAEDEKRFFLAVDGRPLSISAVEQFCRRISKRVGFRIHPHRFRHTFAVNMLRNGTDIRTLQKLMGHASVQILMRYLNLANNEAIEVHQVNSPADRHHAQKVVRGRRPPLKRQQMELK